MIIKALFIKYAQNSVWVLAEFQKTKKERKKEMKTFFSMLVLVIAGGFAQGAIIFDSGVTPDGTLTAVDQYRSGLIADTIVDNAQFQLGNVIGQNAFHVSQLVNDAGTLNPALLAFEVFKNGVSVSSVVSPPKYSGTAPNYPLFVAYTNGFNASGSGVTEFGTVSNPNELLFVLKNPSSGTFGTNTVIGDNYRVDIRYNGQVVGDASFTVIPEPSTFVGILLCAFALLVLRKRIPKISPTG